MVSRNGQHWTPGTHHGHRRAESQHQLAAAKLACSPASDQGDGVTQSWVLTEPNAKLDVSAKKMGCPSGWQGLRQGSGAEQGWFGVPGVSHWM